MVIATMSASAIIVAAGNSRRMGFDKLLAPLGERSVLAHTLAAFEKSECIDAIILVGREDRLHEIKEALRTEKFPKVRKIVAGGAERQDSVRAGMAQLRPATKLVAVHDAARPLITPEEITRVVSAAQKAGAAALGEPVSDTLKRVDDELLISGSVKREKLYAVQTPQVFMRTLLEEAYAAVAEKNLIVTDETSAVELLGKPVMIVPSEDFNFKITWPRDLPLAEFVLAQRRNASARAPQPA
jgi:2-C-methyl-D-erythritol 4-phosphate cytidylyltransferase